MTVHTVVPPSNINKNVKKTNITQNLPMSLEVEIFAHVRLAALKQLLRREPET